MALPTDTCAVACAWCSARMTSSAVIPCAVSRSSTAARTGDTSGPYSRIRCRRRTMYAVSRVAGSEAIGPAASTLAIWSR